MGKLIILSGPSCVGKGPLVKTLELYLKALGKKLARHVLYNTRSLRKGEAQGETYRYSFLWDKAEGDWSKEEDVPYDRNSAIENLGNIATETNRRGGRFDIFTVGNDLQGLDFSDLKEQLLKNAVVLLEIYQEKADDVAAFCKEEGFEVKRIFVSPLSGEDYTGLGCSTDEERAIVTRQIMLDKLRVRGRDKEADMRKRAGRAFDEIKKAEQLAEQNKIHILVNHFGEGLKVWDELQERAGDISNCYRYGESDFRLTEEIDKMFRQFLELVFPGIPAHVCEENLNGGCICGFCGRRFHVTEYTEGNYGSACGSVVETCKRCGAKERFCDATGAILSRSGAW